jgi:hypothetical protein
MDKADNDHPYTNYQLHQDNAFSPYDRLRFAVHVQQDNKKQYYRADKMTRKNGRQEAIKYWFSQNRRASHINKQNQKEQQNGGRSVS